MLIVRHAEVDEILAGRELDIVDLVRTAYVRHDEGVTSVPHSTFLRFPGNKTDRIIGLPAYLGGDTPAAGFKWIASFPGNVGTGIPRANSLMVLNDLATGEPVAVLESSLISAKRTAASAALGAAVLTEDNPPQGVSLIGCGPINLEVLRFLAAVLPSLSEVTLCDLKPARATEFAALAEQVAPGVKVRIAIDAGEAVAAHDLISLATTAGEPHLSIASARPGVTILHLSLRDLFPDTILASQNVVDDADHVCRERTSLDLTERITFHRRFVDASIGALLRGTSDFVRDTTKPLVFSPFGLGALDIAVADFVRREALRTGAGIEVPDFLATH